MSMPGDTDEPHELLQRLRRDAGRRVASLEASFAALVEASRDAATDDEHDPEGHTIAWERQQIAALLAESQAKLADITAAQQRLADGVYGRCTRCGLEIAPERLTAIPATATCIACAG